MNRLILIFCWFLLSSNAQAITPEELARLSEKGATEKRQVDRQLNLNDLHYQIKADELERNKTEAAKQGTANNLTVPGNVQNKIDNRGSATVNSENGMNTHQDNENSSNNQSKSYSEEPTQSNKYTKTQPRQEHPQNVRNARRQEEINQQQRLATTPATNMNTSNRLTVFSDAVEPDKNRHYGIRRGTWIKAELRRNINNAEPGDVGLYLSQEVHGDKKSLPVDTQLFAAKALNNATQRLDMITTYAITPEGREFVLKARIYDTLKVSGLMGIIDADKSKIAERGTTQGLATLGSSVLGEVSGQSIIGRGFAKGGQSMIEDTQNASQIETQQQITIFVAPQPILLRVEETF